MATLVLPFLKLSLSVPLPQVTNFIGKSQGKGVEPGSCLSNLKPNLAGFSSVCDGLLSRSPLPALHGGPTARHDLARGENTTVWLKYLSSEASASVAAQHAQLAMPPAVPHSSSSGPVR